MKRVDSTTKNNKLNKLPLRLETVRTLAERELTLVVAGNCLEGSVISQASTANAAGVC
jgi:hypothetical protein